MSEFKILKKAFSEARKVFRAAKEASEADPDNKELKQSLKVSRKVFREAKAAKLAAKEEVGEKRKPSDQDETPVKKMKVESAEGGEDAMEVEVEIPDALKPENFKTEQACDTICVTNVPKEIVSHEVREHFGDCGGVKDLHFPRNEAQQFIGHVFVRFFSKVGAGRAIEMSGEKGYEVFYANVGEDTLWIRNNKSGHICYSFQNTGTCTRGASCAFTHAGGKPTGQCFDFAKGECERGGRCKFSHGGDGRGRGRGGRGTPGECFSFKKGNCDRGDNCRFSHGGGGGGSRGRRRR